MGSYVIKDYKNCPFWWADGDQCSLVECEIMTCPKVMGERLGFVANWWLPDKCPLRDGMITVVLGVDFGKEEGQEDSQEED